jgi:hypothetical protein
MLRVNKYGAHPTNAQHQQNQERPSSLEKLPPLPHLLDPAVPGKKDPPLATLNFTTDIFFLVIKLYAEIQRIAG